MNEIITQSLEPVILSDSEEAGLLTLQTIDIAAAPKQLIPSQQSIDVEHEPVYRTVYQYVPKSGCYAAVQTPTITVIRKERDEASAKQVVKDMGLIELAEKNHFVIILPNSTEEGWNYLLQTEKNDDLLYLNKLQFALSRGRDVGGHSTLSYYISQGSGAGMVMTMGALNPTIVTSMLLIDLPEDYKVPAKATGAPVTCWICGTNKPVAEYLMKANGINEKDKCTQNDIDFYTNPYKPAIRLLVSDSHAANKELCQLAWNEIFHSIRRWGNHDAQYGTYELRIDFEKAGFKAQNMAADCKENEGLTYNWFEHVPQALKDNSAPAAPLLIGLHGGRCVPLYYAEQNHWHELGEKFGFICAFPAALTNKRWNAGLSMGAMMSNTMAAVHPEIFAAAAPSNAYFEGYFHYEVNPAFIDAENFTVRPRVAERKTAYDYLMPVIQTGGQNDRIVYGFPVRKGNHITETIDFWKSYNHIPAAEIPDSTTSQIGVCGDVVKILGDDKRFELNMFFNSNVPEAPLYAFMVVESMSHAVDLRAPYIQWNFMSQFYRKPEGALGISNK